MSKSELVVRLKRVDKTSMYSPITPTNPKGYSLRVRSSVKRNLNSSFGTESDEASPSKSLKKKTPKKKQKDIILVIDKKERTCRYKHDYESISDSDDSKEEKKRPVTGKRRTRTPARYSPDEFTSPSKNAEQTYMTPLKNKHLSNVRSPKTPKCSPRTPSKTPRSTLKMIKEGLITPSVQVREHALSLELTPLGKVRSQLHVSHVPTALPCRETEYDDIFKFLEGKLFDKCGGCMYVSGVPGTGKTATVTAVVSELVKLAKEGDVPKFDLVSINGMKLTEPRQAYVEIMKQLSGKTVTWQKAQKALDDKFSKKSKKGKLPIILLVDELDIICTKRQDVVYNLLDWPTKSQAQLIVITIANTMDLPERLLMNRVTSRLGLTRLTFQPYTHKQLQQIVINRLVGTKTFNPDAVQLVARKVASVSGDARRALDICRRAAEIAELEGDDTMVTMTHVDEALKAMITQPKVRAIKNASRLEKFLLQAVISEVERTGVEETGFPEVYKMLSTLLTLEGCTKYSTTVVLGALARLSACKLVLVDQKCQDLNQRIVLNVSSDDVYFALKEE